MALKKTYQSWVLNYRSTELNSLADTHKELGAEIANTTNGYYGLAVSVSLGSVDWSAEDNPALYIWLLTDSDAGYEEGEDGDPASTDTPVRPPDLILPIREDSAAQIVYGEILNIPDTFKILMQNQTQAALAATLNTIDYRFFTYEDA